MHPLKKMSRRRFLRATAAGIASASVLAACGQKSGRWRFLTDAEAHLIDAIAEQIIPTDEDPGARDAGVVNFIDKQLMGPYKRFQEQYRMGLAGVDQTSREMFGKAFVLLAWEQQTSVLVALESGKPKGGVWQRHSPSLFFNTARDHTMQGFYGSPRHGGNHKYISYRMLGLDYPPIIGQNRYKTA